MVGSALLGVPLCLIVLFLGLNGKASIINGPVVAFEVTQQGSNGLYLLYLMPVYLAVFAVTNEPTWIAVGVAIGAALSLQKPKIQNED